MADATFTIVEEHWDEAKKIALEAARRGLEAVGIAAVTDVVAEISRPRKHANGESKPLVDTGLLRNSITYALDGEATAITNYEADSGGGSGSYSGTAPEESKGGAVYVGTNVEYAMYVEEGTSKHKAYPYLKSTIKKNLERYKQIFEQYTQVP